MCDRLGCINIWCPDPLRVLYGTPRTPKEDLFWPQTGLLVAPEDLRQSWGARFAPNCHQFVRLSGLGGYEWNEAQKKQRN